MSDPHQHDLIDFINQIGSEMSEEYARIQKRATEDPGTAGDQGEENWAKILRGWLPRSLKIVTRGRIIDSFGGVSPQVDILVLRDSYPERLLDKKLYLGAGVLAAFECKTTLRGEHIRESFKNAVRIKSERRYSIEGRDPYHALYHPILFGLLAHSHAWNSKEVEDVIAKKIIAADAEFVHHPRHQLDIVCVANLATWRVTKDLRPIQAVQHAGVSAERLADPSFPACRTNFSRNVMFSDHRAREDRSSWSFPDPIGGLISYLTRRLAWELPELRSLAAYYEEVLEGGLGGYGRDWPLTVLTNGVMDQLQAGKQLNSKKWGRWNCWHY